MGKNMKKVAFRNLGCKVNEYEMEYMQQRMVEKGYSFVPFDTKADIYVVNTCTVTNIADRKSRQMLHKAKKLNPEAIVVAVGCYVQTDTKGAMADPAIDILIGNNLKSQIAEIIEEYVSKRDAAKQSHPGGSDGTDAVSVDVKSLNVQDLTGSDGTDAASVDMKSLNVQDLTTPVEYENMHISKTAEHTRAFVKIQDGCNQFCSYCAIPLARGRIRSRKLEDILEEINDLANNGYQEVVLTGIHLSSYGLDFHPDENGRIRSYNETILINENRNVNENVSISTSRNANENGYIGKNGYVNYDLLEVINKVADIDGIKRIRLGSLEPRLITEEFLSQLSKVNKLCPHFHLSLQSGCIDTLKRMNRHYTPAEFKNGVELLRRYFNDPAITTDVIVGFPGETEDEFAATKAFLEDIQFFELHVFKYSRRRNTVADRLPNQVLDADKDIRSDILLALDEELSEAFRLRYIGREVEVLFEEFKDGMYVGHTKEYIFVKMASDTDLRGQIRTLVLDGKTLNFA